MQEGGNRKVITESGPLISIITVTKNAASCIESAIQTVLAQTYPNIEHIILDGESTDGTVEILKKYNDKIAYWRSEKDSGVYDAMNKAVKYAKGDWLFFLGADDTLYPGFSKIVERCFTKPNCIYYGCCIWETHTKGFKYTTYRLAKENLPHQAMFYPKSVFEKYSYDVRYKVRADYVLNMQLWADKKYRFEYYDYLISNYASGGFSGQVVDELFAKDRVRLIGKYLGIPVMLRYMLKRYKYKRINYVEY